MQGQALHENTERSPSEKSWVSAKRRLGLTQNDPTWQQLCCQLTAQGVTFMNVSLCCMVTRLFPGSRQGSGGVQAGLWSHGALAVQVLIKTEALVLGMSTECSYTFSIIHNC